MSKYKFYQSTLDDIVKSCKSIADICRKLNIRPTGGNYKTIKSKIKMWNLDISHFTGQAWNQGERFRKFKKEYTLEEILIENSPYCSSYHLKIKLFKNNLKTNCCERCKLVSWNELPIPTELNHINGINTDNRLENLEILCPNCHAQTSNYRRKNSVSYLSDIRLKKYNIAEEIIFDDNSVKYNNSPIVDVIMVKIKKQKCIYNCHSCNAIMKTKSKTGICLQCWRKQNRNVERPDLSTLQNDIQQLGYSASGRKYGVSDNTIRKWIKTK